MAALLIALAGCVPVVSPPPTAQPSPSATATVPAASPTAPIAPDPATIELHALDARFIPADAPVSAGGAILWTAGNPWPSEIWRYVPGTGEPERIFASPRSHATISSVAASAAGYAIVEESEPAFGDGGWRVWFLARPGAEPVELARGVAKRAGALPTLAMDDAHIAWAGFDEPSSGFVSRLQMAPAADPGDVTTLLEQSVEDRLLWFPALHGNELWYAVIEPKSDPDAAGPEYHIETLDLADPAAAPVRFGEGQHDFNPAVNDVHVAWKSNERGDSALNWGTLQLLDRRTGATWRVPLEHLNRPSIGDRFVTFEDIAHARLSVYDPVSRTLLDLAGAPAFAAVPGVTFGGESLSGRLLTFWFGPATASESARIGWAMLPE